MRRALAVLPFLFLATGATAASWTTLKDPDGIFKVSVPSTPAISHDAITNTDNTKVDMLEYTIDRDTSAMIVIVSDLTRYPNADATKVIDGAVGGAAKSGHKVSDKVAIIDGQAGRNIMVVDGTGNQINDQIFFVKGKLYQVMWVVPKKPTKAQRADTRRFAKSFHFTKH
jgi:hypothetical protein